MIPATHPKEKIRILCVDDDQELSAMLDLYKKDYVPLEPIGTVNNQEKAMEQIAKDRPDIVVLDLSVEGSDPLRTIAEISARFPNIRVIVFSCQDDQRLIDEAIEAGACSHVQKDHGVTKLLDAIYEAAAV